MAKKQYQRKTHRRTKRNKRSVSRKQKGGMGVLDTAMVPFGILALQKYMQRNTKKSIKTIKNKKSKRT